MRIRRTRGSARLGRPRQQRERTRHTSRSWYVLPVLGVAAACTGDIDPPPSAAPPGYIGGAPPGVGGTWTPEDGFPPGVGGTYTGTGATPGVGGDGAGGTGFQARPMSLEGAPVYTRFMRLTNEQWENSVTDILRLSAPPGLAQGFEQPVAGATDFTNNEHVLQVSNQLWQSYQLASETVATQVTASPDALTRVYPGTDAAGFIQTLGRRAFRRPLTPEEQQRYQGIFDLGTTTSGNGSAFSKGAALVIRAMLQSPNFLYRTELGESGAPLSGYEVASKLSFWLRNTTPNDALLDAAAAGALDTPSGIAQYATQMLEEPTAVVVMREFHRQLLDIQRYDTISKIDTPAFDPSLNAEYKQSSFLFFDRIFSEGLGLRDILTTSMGFVGPGMAALYGQNATAGGFELRDLGPERLGYFAQVPYLSLHAFNNEPDSIHRGVTINLDILCADPGPALPDLPPIPALEPDQTNRERITELTGVCGATCHNAYINPVGFAFENFDGMGQKRELDNGKPVDTSGTYPFAEGSRSFSGASELMQLMADGRQAHACYAKKLAGYSLQRDMVESDLPLIDSLTEVSRNGAGSLKQVMVALSQSPAFYVRAGGTP